MLCRLLETSFRPRADVAKEAISQARQLARSGTPEGELRRAIGLLDAFEGPAEPDVMARARTGAALLRRELELRSTAAPPELSSLQTLADFRRSRFMPTALLGPYDSREYVRYLNGGRHLYGRRRTSESSSLRVEHVYPNAARKGYEVGLRDLGAQTDLHLLREASQRSNQERQSYRFGETEGQVRGKFRDANGRVRYLPPGHARGEVARIMFYAAAVHGAPLSAEDVQLFLRWSATHPVTDVERAYSRQVRFVQGNVNAFIEHPELVERLFRPYAQTGVPLTYSLSGS